MKQFLGDDFLLDNEVAKKLYFEHAQKMPIFDYHCHLIPEQIADDYHFSSITEAWLGKDGYGDHYKWRLRRELGVSEEYITGNKSDWEKFEKYAQCMPYRIGNPIYEWTHLELKHFFDITKPLCPETAKEIYDECNEKLKTLSARKRRERSNVATVYTTDDPVDDLHYHEIRAKDKTLKTKVAPAWRPDKVINVERDTFVPEREKLAKVTGKEIHNLKDRLEALDERLAFFVDHGCVASDHALDVRHFKKGTTYEEANAVFLKGRKKEPISFEEEDRYKGYLLLHLGRRYHKYNRVQEYHIGALRNNSLRNYKARGADTGFDAVSDLPVAEKLSALLDSLDETDELPKTVLFTLNEKDYVVLVTLRNCFQGGRKGKIQRGTSWWFNDHYDGRRTQLKRLGDDGLLSCFIGRLTDSRSFLSYPRHDYFRREFCNYLGELVEEGRYPEDYDTLGKIVEDVSYNNAVNYFKR